MINIKKLYFFPIFMLFFSCMEPNDEGLWSIENFKYYDTKGFCRDVSVDGELAYVAAGQNGLQIWDLEKDSLLNEFLGYDFEGIRYVQFAQISNIKIDSLNDLIFINEPNRDVMIFNLNEAGILVHQGNEMSAATKDFLVMPHVDNMFTIYAADNDDGLKWNTFGPPESIGNLITWPFTDGGEIYSDGKPLGIDINEQGLLGIAVDQLGVEFFQIEYDSLFQNFSGSPTFISKFDLPGNAEQVYINEIGAFVSCDDFGAYFLSLESIRTGEGLAVSFAEDLTVDHVSVKSNVAVLSLGSRGLALYDISDPFSPISKGIFNVGYVYKTYFWGDHILICTRSGLQVSKIKY